MPRSKVADIKFERKETGSVHIDIRFEKGKLRTKCQYSLNKECRGDRLTIARHHNSFLHPANSVSSFLLFKEL